MGINKKEELIKKLKEEFYNDVLVLLDSVTYGFKCWIFGTKIEAKKHYNKILNSGLVECYKPSTLEIINLWGTD